LHLAPIFSIGPDQRRIDRRPLKIDGPEIKNKLPMLGMMTPFSALDTNPRPGDRRVQCPLLRRLLFRV